MNLVIRTGSATRQSKVNEAEAFGWWRVHPGGGKRGFLVAVLFLSTTTDPPPGGENRRLVVHSSAWSGLPFTFFDYPDRVAVFMFSRVVMPDDLDSLRVVRSQSLPRPPSDGRRTVPLWVVTYQCSGRFRLINNII